MKLKSVVFPKEIADEMIRAILENRKSAIRFPIKPQPKYAGLTEAGIITSDNPIRVENGLVVTEYGKVTTWNKMPYRPGDVLYVREAWTVIGTDGTHNKYGYRADGIDYGVLWKPSVWMTCEEARIFLRVSKVRVERLQDISEEDALREGVSAARYEHGLALYSFSKLWDNGTKAIDRALYGWDANPWVMLVEFERISKEEVWNALQEKE